MEQENATRTAGTDLPARATHLRELIENVLAESAALLAELEDRGVEFHWAEEETTWGLEYELVGLRALEAVGCDPVAYAYFVARAHGRSTLDELRSESPEAWSRLATFHARFEARFPELAVELARMAFRTATFVQYPADPSLERRALAAVAELAADPIPVPDSKKPPRSLDSSGTATPRGAL